MPVVRVCARCRKGFLCSTYQLIEHWTNCSPVHPTNAKLETASPANRPTIQNSGIRTTASSGSPQLSTNPKEAPKTVL